MGGELGSKKWLNLVKSGIKRETMLFKSKYVDNCMPNKYCKRSKLLELS